MGIAGNLVNCRISLQTPSKLRVSLSPYLCYRNTMESTVTVLAVGTLLFMQNLKWDFLHWTRGKSSSVQLEKQTSAVIQLLKFSESVSLCYAKEVNLCFPRFPGTVAVWVPLQDTIAFCLSKLTLITAFGIPRMQLAVDDHESFPQIAQWHVCLQAHLWIVPSWKDVPTYKKTSELIGRENLEVFARLPSFSSLSF